MVHLTLSFMNYVPCLAGYIFFNQFSHKFTTINSDKNVLKLARFVVLQTRMTFEEFSALSELCPIQ